MANLFIFLSRDVSERRIFGKNSATVPRDDGPVRVRVIRVGPCDPYPLSGKEGDVCDTQRDAAGMQLRLAIRLL